MSADRGSPNQLAAFLNVGGGGVLGRSVGGRVATYPGLKTSLPGPLIHFMGWGWSGVSSSPRNIKRPGLSVASQPTTQH